MSAESLQKPGEFTYCERCPARVIRRDGANMEKVCDLSKLDGRRYNAPSICKVPSMRAVGVATISPEKMLGDLLRRRG